LDEYARYGEHATSPPSSSASTKIGSGSVDKPPGKHRQLDAVIIPIGEKSYKAPGPRRPIGKPPAGGTKTQTKATTNATRSTKDKGTPKQRPTQNSEGSATKGPTQKVIRRVHATVEMPIKVEDDEDEFARTPVNDARGRAPSDKNPKPSKTAKKATKPAEPPRTKSKSWQAYRDDDATPPAPTQVPKRRKSGIDQDYYDPGEDIYQWRSLEDANVRHRPPSRRKSIRVLRESDFEYREGDEEEEETDTDELNLGVCLLLDGFFSDTLAEPRSFLFFRRGASSIILMWKDLRSNNGRMGHPQMPPLEKTGEREKRWMLWMLMSPW